MIIKQLQEYAKNILKSTEITEASLKIKLVLSHVLNKPKEYLITHDDEEVNSKDENAFKCYIEKLSNGVPLEYITNKKEFMKLEFYVDENVLIPRADTEILVQEIIKRVSSGKVLDLCTGSGSIAVSLAKYIQDAKVYASDISKEALEVAKKNAKANGVNISNILSDLFNNIIYTDFDVIVSNPPYIESDVISSLAEDVKHEPRLALDGGKDGLDFYRRIIKEAPHYLKCEGILAFEIGYNQADSVCNLMKDKFYDIEVIKDLSGNNRVVIAKLKNN